MQDFAAQQLTKKQMNEIRGGKWYMRCIIVKLGPDSDIPAGSTNDFIYVEGKTLEEATSKMAEYLSPGHVAINCQWGEI